MSRRYDYCSQDNDLKIIKTKLNTLDPITKKEIVNPYKNKYCGHVYEKGTILAWIKSTRSRGKETKCPYAGCTEKNISEYHLVKTTVDSRERSRGDRVHNYHRDEVHSRVDKHYRDSRSIADSSDCKVIKIVEGRRHRHTEVASQHQPAHFPPPSASARQQSTSARQQSTSAKQRAQSRRQSIGTEQELAHNHRLQSYVAAQQQPQQARGQSSAITDQLLPYPLPTASPQQRAKYRRQQKLLQSRQRQQGEQLQQAQSHRQSLEMADQLLPYPLPTASPQEKAQYRRQQKLLQSRQRQLSQQQQLSTANSRQYTAMRQQAYKELQAALDRIEHSFKRKMEELEQLLNL